MLWGHLSIRIGCVSGHTGTRFLGGVGGHIGTGVHGGVGGHIEAGGGKSVGGLGAHFRDFLVLQ